MNVNIIIKNAKTIAEYKEMKEKMKQLAEKCYNKHKKKIQRLERWRTSQSMDRQYSTYLH